MIDKELIWGFQDEETDVWVSGAIAIGELGLEAEYFIAERVGKLAHPKKPDINRHTHRHAYCALAALLEKEGADYNPELEFVLEGPKNKTKMPVWDFARVWLLTVVRDGLSMTPISFFEVAEKMPVFEEIRQRRLTMMREELERFRLNKEGKMPAESLEKALNAKSAAIELLDRKNTGFSDIAKWLKIEGEKKFFGGSQQDWDFASFISGASPMLMKLWGIDIDLLVPALLALAGKDDKKIALLSSLPRLISRYPRDTQKTLVCMMVKDLILPDVRSATWAEYFEQVARILPQESFDALTQHLEEPFKSEVVRWLEIYLDNGRDSGFRKQATLTFLNHCSAQLVDDFSWNGLPKNPKCALGLLSLVLLNPDFVSKTDLSLESRIRLLESLIRRWSRDNEQLTMEFVRVLKILLKADITRPGMNAAKIANIAHQQVRLIQPLLALKGMRGTLSKDLATIATRCLVYVYESVFCESERAEGDTSEYLFLFYKIQFALPEAPLLRTMKDYAQNETVRADLVEVARLLESIIELEKAFKDETSEARLIRYTDIFEEYHSYLSVLESHYREDGSSSFSPEKLHELMKLLSHGNERLQQGHLVALSWLMETKEACFNEVELSEKYSTSPEKKNEKRDWDEEKKRLLQSAADSLIQELRAFYVELADARKNQQQDGGDVGELKVSLERQLEVLTILKRFYIEHFPLLERLILVAALKDETLQVERNLELLISVGDRDEEFRACEAVKDPGTPEFLRSSIRKWMLDRFMLDELSGANGGILKWLINPVFIAFWVLLPFAGSGLIRFFFPNDSSIWAFPYFGALAANVMFLFVILRSKNLPSGISSASLLLPQIVGTLFLGIMENFSADESWSLAFASDPVIRLVNLSIFGLAAYIFTRCVMVGGQSISLSPSNHDTKVAPSKVEKRILRKRAMCLFSLGIWQANALVTLFSILQGKVMAGAGRADLGAVEFDSLTAEVNGWIPSTIAVCLGPLETSIYPWAILTWTIHLFFFSAIFERVVNRGDA